MSPISGAGSSCVGPGAAALPSTEVVEAVGAPPLRPAPARRSGSAPGRFARMLPSRSPSDPAGADGAGRAAAVAALTSWFRAESAGFPLAEAQPSSVKAAAAPGAPRVLMGGGPAGPEARIQIEEGPWAGAEIRLHLAATGVVEAELLTPTMSSRQTLALAMEEVGHRLRAKGLLLRGVPMGNQPDRPRDGRGGTAEPESRPADDDR